MTLADLLKSEGPAKEGEQILDFGEMMDRAEEKALAKWKKAHPEQEK